MEPGTVKWVGKAILITELKDNAPPLTVRLGDYVVTNLPISVEVVEQIWGKECAEELKASGMNPHLHLVFERRG